MSSPTQDRHRVRPTGQILPFFAISLVVILALAALLYDGATMLVSRRKLQNVGDAAALAGANVLQTAGSAHVCSTAGSSPPGAPRQDIVDAVLASITTNWPDFPMAGVAVSCPDGFDNQAVAVDLDLPAATYFMPVIGATAGTVSTTSAAINGQITGTSYSVVILDPRTPSWPRGRDGCPAALISGGPTLVFDGSMYVNSSCPAGAGGALATNGNAASITFNNGSRMRVTGQVKPAALTLFPAPLEGVAPIEDPLIDLDPVPYATMTVRSTTRLVLNNTTQVLNPGVYRGGIQLKNQSIALLRPGVYVMDGGGLDLGAQAEICSISASSITLTCSAYAIDCQDVSCGVLVFNRGSQNGTDAMGPISIAAGATVKLRAYDDRARGGQHFQYRNLLIWQDALPVPAASWAQPVISLSGGGTVDIAGTIYAPKARVAMGGSSGGSGGVRQFMVQFVVWDLEMSGTSSFHFFYSDTEFSRPRDYGLVQ